MLPSSPLPLGNCLMQRAAKAGSEAAALFLATHGAMVNHVNKLVSSDVVLRPTQSPQRS